MDLRVSQVDLKLDLVVAVSSFVNVTCPGRGRGSYAAARTLG